MTFGGFMRRQLLISTVVASVLLALSAAPAIATAPISLPLQSTITVPAGSTSATGPRGLSSNGSALISANQYLNSYSVIDVSTGAVNSVSGSQSAAYPIGTAVFGSNVLVNAGDGGIHRSLQAYILSNGSLVPNGQPFVLTYPGSGLSMGAGVAIVGSTHTGDMADVVTLNGSGVPVSRVSLPQPAGQSAFWGFSTALLGNIAIVGSIDGMNGSISIIDISNPSIPNVLSTTSLPNSNSVLYEVAMTANTVYVAGFDNGASRLWVYDLQGNGSIALSSTLPLPAISTGMSVSGTLLAVGGCDYRGFGCTAGTQYLRVFDISNGPTPVEVANATGIPSSAELRGAPNGNIAFVGDTLAVAVSDGNTVLTFDVSALRPVTPAPTPTPTTTDSSGTAVIASTGATPLPYLALGTLLAVVGVIAVRRSNS